jgi:anti-sigma B factor antagonist
MDASFDVAERDGWAVVTVTGEVDVASAPRLREQLVGLVTDGQTRLVLDLDNVDFLDSTGLGVIVGALKRARTHGGDLRVACAQPRILKVFEITGLHLAMPIAETIDDAISQE